MRPLPQLFTLILSAVCAIGVVDRANADPPRNVILCIGDGMGPEHVRAAGLYLHGEAGTLSFESFEAIGTVSTHAADDPITDSAAAGTAMASGQKVNNRVIAVAIPGDGRELPSILKQSQRAGKRVGMVTTTELTHATPAAFAANAPSRRQRDVIAKGYLRTKPDVMLGGGGAGMDADEAAEAGYTVVTNRAELEAAAEAGATPLCGLFGDGNMPYEYDDFAGAASNYETFPHLREMTMHAISLLEDDPDGFFLLVEGGRIDHAAHDHELERNIHETIEFDRTVAAIAAWAKGREDTLLIVTADHETGGMSIVSHAGQGEYPAVTWSTWDHTGVDVGVYATGQGARLFEGHCDNTTLPKLIGWADAIDR